MAPAQERLGQHQKALLEEEFLLQPNWTREKISLLAKLLKAERKKVQKFYWARKKQFSTPSMIHK